MEPILAMAHEGNVDSLSAYLHDTGLNINSTSESGETVLFSAIRRKDEQAVRTLIKLGADVNHKDSQDNTAVIEAARLGAVNILHLLREANLSVDKSNKSGETALMFACCKGHAMFAQTLIDFGASVNKADAYGMTAVMLASQKDKYLKCLDLLLAAGADANATSNTGLTALMLASREGALRCVKQLILHGVNKNAVDVNGMSGLMLAAREGHHDCLRTLILADCDTNIKDTSGDTAVILAAMYNRVECVKLLNPRCADVNVQNNMGMTALMVATIPSSHQDVLQQLLLAGARTDIKNAKGHTALMTAAMCGNVHAVKFLIDSNVDINIFDNDGDNVLTLAAREDKEQILAFLIDESTSLKHANERDETALMVAAKYGRTRCLDLLLKNHAEINYKSKKTGMTALMLAAVNDRVNCLNLLIQRGAMLELKNQESKTALMITIEKGVPNTFHILLQAGASIHATNQDGQTPLMLAATKQDTLYIRQLLQAINVNDYINIKDTHGKTALVLAAERGLALNVEILLLHGAEVNMVNNKGESPLVLASLAGHESCVEILARNRAWFMNDDNGQKALMKAIVLGQTNIVETLIYAGANANLPDKLGRKPLLYAVGVRQAGCVEVLLKHRTYVNQTDQDGNTALMYAAESRSLDTWSLRRSLDINTNSVIFNDSSNKIRNKTLQCLRLLINAGADPNKVNTEERTAIMLAVMSKTAEATTHLRLLLDHGGDANLQDKDGYTALMYAVEKILNDECVVTLLRAKVNINAQNKKGQSALMLVKSHKHLEHLLAANADVSLTDNRGRTALMRIAGKEHLISWPSQQLTKLFSLLTGPYAGVDTQDSQGETALMKASSAGNEDHIQALLDIGANVHLNDLKGRTALMHIAISETTCDEGVNDYHVFHTDDDRSEIAQLLVDHGSHVNVQDENGVSALMMASSKGLEETVQTLLDCGANVNLTDYTGKTPLMHITDRKKLFEEAEHASIARKFVNCGSDVNQRDDNGVTALMLASFRGMGKTVQALLDCGADVNLQDHTGKTALMHIAVPNEPDEEDSDDGSYVNEDGLFSVVDQLVEHGADVNMRDDNGMTAVMHVAKFKHFLSRFLICALTRHHANTDLFDNYGKTALAHACEKCDSVDDCETVVSLATNDAFPKLRVTNKTLLTPASLSNYLPLYEDDEYVEAIARTRLLVSNGVMPLVKVIEFWGRHDNSDSERWSPLLQTIHQSLDDYDADLHIAKYLIANCYLSTTDVDRIRSDDLPDSLNKDVKDFLKRAFANPWPLVKLAQIAVSTAMGPSPRREERIRQTGLPQPLMDCLMFDRPIALLHNNWDLIPMCFEPRQYALQPSPYPLLYNWPFGHNVVQCDCNVCEQKDENFRFTQIIRS